MGKYVSDDEVTVHHTTKKVLASMARNTIRTERNSEVIYRTTPDEDFDKKNAPNWKTKNIRSIISQAGLNAPTRIESKEEAEKKKKAKAEKREAEVFEEAANEAEYGESLDEDEEVTDKKVEIPDESGFNNLQNSLPQNPNADPDCNLCHGTGWVRDTESGSWDKCMCLTMTATKRNIERMTVEIEKQKKQSFYDIAKDVVIEDRAWHEGLIHPESAHRNYNSDNFLDCIQNDTIKRGYIIKESSAGKVRGTMEGILNSIAKGNKLRFSYMLYLPSNAILDDFAFSCIKSMLVRGKRVVPYITLTSLQTLKIRHNYDLNLRKGNGYLTDSEEEMKDTLTLLQWNKYLELKEKMLRDSEEIDILNIERRIGEHDLTKKYMSLVDFYEDLYNETSYNDEQKEVLYEHKNDKYTYTDYIRADLVIVSFTDKENAYLEGTALTNLLREREMRCKPTIILTSRDIEDYKSLKKGTGSDVYIFSQLITKDKAEARYSRAYYVPVELVRGTIKSSGKSVGTSNKKEGK